MSPDAQLAFSLGHRAIRTALVTNFYFDSYSGSPIVALDIAKQLRAAGAQVSLAVCSLNEPMKSEADSAGIDVIDLTASDAGERLSDVYDLIWGQHWAAYNLVILNYRVRFRHLVLSSLSPFAQLESFSPLARQADALVCNSEETLAAHAPRQERLKDKGLVLANSLDESWFERASPPPTCLRSLAVVSNNTAPELDQALSAIEEMGVRVDRVGLPVGQERVDASFVDRQDAIVTIGHSVQKALARMRPAYVYDRFGGPGWLKADIFDEALRFNFSGRHFGRKLANDIADEILTGFTEARAQIGPLAEKARSKFNLALGLARVIERLPERQGDRALNYDRFRHELSCAQQTVNFYLRREAFSAMRNIKAPLVRSSYELRNVTKPTEVELFYPRSREYCETLSAFENILMAGALILDQRHALKDLRLLFAHGAAERARTKLSSPGIAKIKPDDARYHAARFEFLLDPMKTEGDAILEVETLAGARLKLADVSFSRAELGDRA